MNEKERFLSKIENNIFINNSSNFFLIQKKDKDKNIFVKLLKFLKEFL